MCKVTNSSSLLGTVLVFTLKMQHPRNSFSLRQTQMVGYPKHIKENSTYDICPAPKSRNYPDNSRWFFSPQTSGHIKYK